MIGKSQTDRGRERGREREKIERVCQKNLSSLSALIYCCGEPSCHCSNPQNLLYTNTMPTHKLRITNRRHSHTHTCTHSHSEEHWVNPVITLPV